MAHTDDAFETTRRTSRRKEHIETSKLQFYLSSRHSARELHTYQKSNCRIIIVKCRQFRVNSNIQISFRVEQNRAEAEAATEKMLLRETIRFFSTHRTVYCYLCLSLWIFLLITGEFTAIDRVGQSIH